MIVVKLIPGNPIEFETREQLEEYIIHIEHEFETYSYLQEMEHRQYLSIDVQDWISEQYTHAKALRFCAIECREDFDILEAAWAARKEA